MSGPDEANDARSYGRSAGLLTVAFGVTGVLRKKYTTTAAGGRHTHSVHQLMSLRFFDAR